MSLEHFVENFEEAVEDIEPGSLSGETRYRELEEWDSLAVLTVVSMVDAEYGKRINAKSLKRHDTLADLYQSEILGSSTST